MPEALAWVGGNGVPYIALIASTSGMAAAIMLAIFAPGRSFLLLYGLLVAGMFFVWIIILLAHLGLSPLARSSSRRCVADSAAMVACSQILALTILAAIAMSTFLVEGLRYTVPGFAVFLLATTVVYRMLKRRNRNAQVRVS